MADSMSPLDLVSYYANLLIVQYLGKPKAYGTISAWASQVVMPEISQQQLTFSDVAASGHFIIQYSAFYAVSVAWNDSASTIQAATQLIPGLGSVTVTGSIASQSLNITFVNVAPVVPLITIPVNNLENGSSEPILVSVSEIDQTLPLLVQNGFNLLGSNIAVGAQLDILGKYVGVSRTYANLDLSDADFLTVIQFAIVQNNSGSSLATIQSNLNQFFPDQFIAVDYQDMTMSYIFNSNLVNLNVLSVLLNEKLLPRPMAVGLTVIIIPHITSLFGFRTYDEPNDFAKPFNTYDVFNTDWFFLSYGNVYIE